MHRRLIVALVALCACQTASLATANPAAHDSAASAAAANRFAAIDAHALAAPRSVTRSIRGLASYLTRPARNDRERARAIFRWITRYIAYDPSADGYNPDPEYVLATRSAICLGYAELFKALAQAAGMRAVVVLGHAKEFKPQSLDGTWLNHAWNAVEIDGRWQLLDCCWGAGHFSQQGQFVQAFAPYYFLTPPEAFVYDHLPSDPRWQLLEAPVSRYDYAQRVQVRPAFFECGLQLVSHRSYRVQADGILEMMIGAPAKTYLTALLYRNGKQLDEHYAFAQRCEGGFLIRAVFPSQGDYVLRIFARRGNAATGDYAWALDYAVHAFSGREDAAGFPQAYGAFLANDCELEQPLDRVLAAGAQTEFRLTAPNATDVVVVSGNSWHRLSREGPQFRGAVQVAPGDVFVYARFPQSAAYQGLLRYEAQQPPVTDSPDERPARTPYLVASWQNCWAAGVPLCAGSLIRAHVAPARHDPFSVLPEPVGLPKNRLEAACVWGSTLLPWS